MNNKGIYKHIQCLDEKTLSKKLTGIPKLSPESKSRSLDLDKITTEWFYITQYTLKAYERIVTMIETGYRRREGLHYDIAKSVINWQPDEKSQPPAAHLKLAPADIYLLGGESGMGKSTIVDKLLPLLGNQLEPVTRPRYKTTRIKYLFVRCPANSFKQLLEDIIETIAKLVSEKYQVYYNQRMSVDTLVKNATGLCARHEVGILIIDEANNMADFKGYTPHQCANQIRSMCDKIGLPLLLIASPRFDNILKLDLQLARRVVGKGTTNIRLLDNQTKLKDGKTEWSRFFNQLWKLRVLKDLPIHPGEMTNLFFSLTRGNIGITVNLYLALQRRAIEKNRESFTEGEVKNTFKKEFKAVISLLDDAAKLNHAAHGDTPFHEQEIHRALERILSKKMTLEEMEKFLDKLRRGNPQVEISAQIRNGK